MVGRRGCIGLRCEYLYLSFRRGFDLGCNGRRFADSEDRFFGYGMVAVGLTFVPVATMTYVSDCYLPVNADALLLVNGLKVCHAAQPKTTHGTRC
jgi:hypothetical protein